MKSKVYFIAVDKTDDPVSIADKLRCLLEESKVMDFIQEKENIAVKLHFGEEGNTGYVRPEYMRVISEHILNKQASCFLADTNTLYRGRRTNSSDHLRLAYEHGFTYDKVKAQVIIPDDTLKSEIKEVEINQKFIKRAFVAGVFQEAFGIVDVAHFKGHIMTGFGGAIKNIGMGCAARQGKLAQHSDVSPFVILNNCTGCAACELVCPVKAIIIKDGKSIVDNLKCIGCASCIAACKYNAIEINWEAGGKLIQEKMVEYAKAILDKKKQRLACINFAIKITKECDCLAKDDPRISPDVGIFASTDPVSIDKACLDKISSVCGKDVFRQAHPKRDGTKQLEYAQELGLGSMDYDLVEVKLK
jgi:uncharacterized Fe-S center protein